MPPTERHGSLAVAGAVVLALSVSASAGAQTIRPAADRDRQAAVSLTAGVDFASAYMLRGFQQDDTKLITSPRINLDVALYRSEGRLQSIRAGAGLWNALNPGEAGTDGPSGKLWYERRFIGTVQTRFTSGVWAAASYAAYTSPNSMFTTVKEASASAGLDHHLFAGIKPYALVAFELDTAPGVGQVDGGFRPGRYLEFGATPGYALPRARLTVPVKVGLSLGGYYELAGKDHTFGFAGVGTVVTVPVTGSSRVGRWNVHGGVEVLTLGEAPRVWNDGDRVKSVVSFGVGWQPSE